MTIDHQSGRKLLEFLKAITVLGLVGAGFLATFLAVNYGTVEVPGTRFREATQVANVPMLVAAIALFAQAVISTIFVFAFCYLISSVAGIHEMLADQVGKGAEDAKPSPEDEHANDT